MVLWHPTEDKARTIPCAEFRFASADGLHVASARWDSRSQVRRVAQIAHGMGEYIGRCADLVDALVSAGVTVYGNDHRGHGRTAPSPSQLGDFGTGRFDLLVEDMVRLSQNAAAAGTATSRSKRRRRPEDSESLHHFAKTQ